MRDPSRTHMFAEAAEAGAVVAAQRAANREMAAAIVRSLLADPRRTVLTCARGSSDHAATYGKYLIETRLGIPTVSIAPSVVSLYRAPSNAESGLCLAISQSGRSPDLIASLEAAKAGGAITLAMVNDDASPLAAAADHVLPLHAGPERSVPATKSFIASLAALATLVAGWAEDDALDQAVAALPGLLTQAWEADWSPLVHRLERARGLYVIGRGVGLGVAQEAALKLKETCGLHAEAYSAAEVRHGPMALIGPDFPMLVFRQSDETEASIDEAIDAARGRGADLFVAGAGGRGVAGLASVAHHPAIEPILQIQSFYRAAVNLSLRRGFDPDRPPHLAKVTETL